MRLLPPGGQEHDPLLDCLFSSCGIEAEIAREAEDLEILSGLRIPVARVGHLLAMKILAFDDRNRPQDREDIRNLLAEADPAERTRARTALACIAARGFHRGRDLEGLWREVSRD